MHYTTVLTSCCKTNTGTEANGASTFIFRPRSHIYLRAPAPQRAQQLTSLSGPPHTAQERIFTSGHALTDAFAHSLGFGKVKQVGLQTRLQTVCSPTQSVHEMTVVRVCLIKDHWYSYVVLCAALVTVSAKSIENRIVCIFSPIAIQSISATVFKINRAMGHNMLYPSKRCV